MPSRPETGRCSAGRSTTSTPSLHGSPRCLVLKIDDAVGEGNGRFRFFVTDRAIDEAGIGCEPASACSLAGVKKLRAAGVIQKGDRVVCVLTGNILKDTDIIMKADRRAQMIEIEPNLEAVRRVLEG